MLEKNFGNRYVVVHDRSLQWRWLSVKVPEFQRNEIVPAMFVDVVALLHEFLGQLCALFLVLSKGSAMEKIAEGDIGPLRGEKPDVVDMAIGNGRTKHGFTSCRPRVDIRSLADQKSCEINFVKGGPAVG